MSCLDVATESQDQTKSRKEILTQQLYAEYDGVVDITDAIVALRSRNLHASIPSNKDKIYYLLDQWRRHEEIRSCDSPSASDLPDRPRDCGEVAQLLRLHKIMEYCFDRFCNNVPCPEWAEQEHWETHVLPVSLSPVEKTRFFRALYRLQIYGNIFGPIENEPLYDGTEHTVEDDDDWEEVTFDPVDAWRMFFGTMTPWEFQEFGCVRHYIYEQYTQPYKEVADYFAKLPLMPMGMIPEELIDPLPSNVTILDSDEIPKQHFIHQPCLANQGPAFFYKFMHLPSFLHRRDLIIVNSRWRGSIFPDHIWLYEVPEGFPRPLLYPADCFDFDWYLEDTKRLWAVLSPSERPNHACDVLWFTTYNGFWNPDNFSDLYSARTDLPYWKWAYAIWDYERLIEWKAPLQEINRGNPFKNEKWLSDVLPHPLLFAALVLVCALRIVLSS